MAETIREVASITTAHHQREGAGFVVRRPFPTAGLDWVDPFLLLDEMGPVEYAAGEALGARAVIETHTPMVYQDWTLQPGADVTVALPSNLRGLVYVFEGAALIGNQQTRAGEGQLATLEPGEAVRLGAADVPARL